jgi:hypothetical protein
MLVQAKYPGLEVGPGSLEVMDADEAKELRVGMTSAGKALSPADECLVF